MQKAWTQEQLDAFSTADDIHVSPPFYSDGKTPGTPPLGFGPLLRMATCMYAHIMDKILDGINQLLNNKPVNEYYRQGI